MKKLAKPALLQRGEIYCAPDLKMALEELTKLGYDLEVETVPGDFGKLRVTCGPMGEKFIIQGIKHNDWPDDYKK